MADSDDDYDRKRRDKFRGERNEYRDMGGRRPPPNDDMRSRRDDWSSGGGIGGDRGGGGDWGNRRGGPQRSIDYRLGGGHRVQHEFSPPNKRPRVEWDRYSHDSSGFGSGYGSGFDNAPPPQHMGGYNHPPPQQQPPPPHKKRIVTEPRENSDGHPHMLSFKAWLSTQDDQISDQDALSKYADYKKEFKRQQLNEFFVAHREEEWFRNKYHPDDSTKRKEEQFLNLKTRVNTFVEFMDTGRFQGVTLDATQSEKIIKLMDWYVIRLEGGSNDDAAKLLSEEAIMKPRPPLLPKPDEKVKVDAEVKKVDSSLKDSKENGDESEASLSGSDSEDDKNSEDEGRIRKRKKEKKVSTSAVEALEAALETNNSIKSDDERDDANLDDDASNDAKKREKKRRADSDKGSDLSDIDDDNENNEKDKKSDDEGDEEDDDGEDGGKKKKDKKSKKNVITSISTSSISKDQKKEVVPEEEELPQLHRTSSIFLRNLSPSITKQEVEALCKKYPGFLRVAIADPQADRRWIRRGWVTFKRNVNIKEICWNLNNIRLRDTELGPIVNRDLSRRVRTINGITPHKTIVRNDIRLAAKVIQHLDAKWNLWDEDLQQETKQESYGVYSTNPVLKNITDYLIEEASAEEEELLGLSNNSDGEIDGEREEKNNSIERDDELIKVLDRLLFYLRFVHSLDYYNHAEYPYEDEMPNRVGIIHARGMPPATKVNVMELQEYNRNFESKISTFVQPIITLTDIECKDFGMKDQEAEVEKFIVVNTKELGKDKWLCPLSGKKFKGPEFVRKHILNKHGEKLEEVKKEVIFFNNFLRDPKRPASPEPQRGDRGNQQPPNMMQQRREPPMQERDFHPAPMYPPYGGGYNSGYGGGGGMYGGPPSRPPPQQGYPPYRQDFAPRGRPGFRTGGRDYGNRSIISYRDLDAPNEPDDF